MAVKKKEDEKTELEPYQFQALGIIVRNAGERREDLHILTCKKTPGSEDWALLAMSVRAVDGGTIKAFYDLSYDSADKKFYFDIYTKTKTRNLRFSGQEGKS